MKICIVAHNAYGALTGEKSGAIGGVERQTELMGRWLANRGHQVSVITWNEGGDDIEWIGKIKVIKVCKPKQGIPILRFFFPRWTSLNKALALADADIYYHNCFEVVTGQVALWCRLNNKHFIYSLASESDCDANYQKERPWYEKKFFSYGLTHADLLIAQTQRQQQKLMDNLQLESDVINMPGTPPVFKEGYQREALFHNKNILWVGRLRSVKRIEWLLDIAQKLPQYRFTVAGPKTNSPEYMQEVMTRFEATANVEYLGKVSRTDMIDVYQQASILCCTSAYEGFPNTFLEAWSYGIPVITTFDPDDIVQKHNLGFFATTQDGICEALSRYMETETIWQESSQNCVNYYQQHHTQEKVMSQFEQAFLSLLNGNVGLHFDQKSDQWHDYYTRQDASISHLDLQQRLAHTKALLHGLNGRFPENEPRRLLDLGCGTGSSVDTICETGKWDIYAVDISEKMVRTARQRYPGIQVTLGNATQMSFADETFSVIVALGVLEYIAEYPLALSEIRRVLNKNGRLIVSIPNRSSLFRKLRKFEKYVSRQIKKRLGYPVKKGDIYHRKWSLNEFSNTLKLLKFDIEEVRFSGYGLLFPSLEDSAFDIKLAHWLTKKLKNSPKLNLLFANTITIQATKQQ